MNLTLLQQLPELSVYYDSWNNWLFLDWQGPLTLPGVQAACLAVASCCQYPHQRVLNSLAHVTRLPSGVTAWLSLELLPLLPPVGVAQLAWVRAGRPGSRLLEQALTRPTTGLHVQTFDEVEPAVAWLQHGRPPGAVQALLPPAAAQQQVQQFRRRVAASLGAGDAPGDEALAIN